MDEQQRVAAFIETHDMETPPTFRVLDLVSEVGEIAKEVNRSTGYGTSPTELSIRENELGDALFALLALAESVDIEADTALDVAIDKYERRLARQDHPGSENR